MNSLRYGHQSIRTKILSWKIIAILTLFSQCAVAANQLKDVDILLGNDGVTRVMLQLKDKSVATDFDKKANSLFIKLKETTAEKSITGIKETTDKNKFVASVFVKPEGKNVSIEVKNKGRFGYDYYQTENILIIELFAFSTQRSNLERHSNIKENDNISINFQDIPIRSVLQMVAEHNGFNLVVSDTVKGSLTLRLDDVPWKKALDTILKVKGLDKRKIGNILLVAPKSELDEQEQLMLEMRRKEQELASLRSEVIKINYASAQELKDMFDGEESDSISLLSQRGSIGVDLRTNSLVIKDLSENIDAIKSLLNLLDVPVDQVEIEARIVTVDEGTLDEIGVRWGVANRNGSFTTSGSIEGNLGWEGDLDFETGSGDVDGGTDSDSVTNNVDDFLNVNLGAKSINAGSIAFQIANLGKNLLIDLELSALQAESRAEIISSPRLLTTNKRPAYIEQGTELPYLEASSSGATAVAFKKAVLSLSVTPQITHDDKLVLDLQVTQDKPSLTVKAGQGEAMSISTQRIGTQVLVNDGETIVLGGIFQHEISEGEDKIPLLGDIPYFGQLFRRNYETVGKRELLIFVTPRIMAQ